jgi:hypothetical protein
MDLHPSRTQTTLRHDPSHELCSPLARMQAAVGLGRQNPDDADRRPNDRLVR